MSFTVKNLENSIRLIEFKDRDYTLIGEENFYNFLASSGGFNSSVKTDYGLAKRVSVEFPEVDSWGDSSGPIELIFSVNDRFFKKTGHDSSWDDTTWDGELVEVERVPVVIYEYKEIDS